MIYPLSMLSHSSRCDLRILIRYTGSSKSLYAIYEMMQPASLIDRRVNRTVKLRLERRNSKKERFYFSYFE